MSYSIVRLTLYGLLTSLESDLREIIRRQIGRERPIDAVIGSELLEVLKRRAEQDDEGGARTDLLLYLDFADSFKLVNSSKAVLDPDLRKALKAGGPILERLAPIRNRVMHSRPLRFDDATQVAEAVRLLLREPLIKFRSTRHQNVR